MCSPRDHSSEVKDGEILGQAGLQPVERSPCVSVDFRVGGLRRCSIAWSAVAVRANSAEAGSRSLARTQTDTSPLASLSTARLRSRGVRLPTGRRSPPCLRVGAASEPGRRGLVRRSAGHDYRGGSELGAALQRGLGRPRLPQREAPGVREPPYPPARRFVPTGTRGTTPHTVRRRRETVAQADIHVVEIEGEWAVKVEGLDRVASTHGTQAEAIIAGREAARTAKSELLIHGRDGAIRERDSSGHDPAHRPG
jgi:Uncharacterized protein conserved in bacteria (DUF2188)